MKAKLLILASAILAGCSDTPSSGAIEKALESAVASCKNVEVFDVKKTNGFQDDGFYRVEYSYGVRLKDAGQLKKMKELWNEEKRRDAEYGPAYAEYQQKVGQVQAEIDAIEKTFWEQRPLEKDFPPSYSSNFNIRHPAYEAALEEHRQKKYAAKQPKEKELEALEAAWTQSRAEVPSPRIFGKLSNAIGSLYREGCSSEAWKYVGDAMVAHGNLVRRANPPDVKEKEMDASLYFEVQEIGMNGVMPMRKTENGWRKI